MAVGDEFATLLVPARRNVPGDATSLLERALDLTLILLALPLIMIAGAAIALAIYLDSPGPVIYRSMRVGRDGELFQMLKFRKMHREASSHPLTLHADDRFTPIGQLLANTRLDELPQVVNILRGQMRIVGPRPELQYFTEQFADEYQEILTVTPGLTGPSQLRFVNEKSMLVGPSPVATYADEVLPVKIQIDLHYARHRCFRGDLAIIGRTAALPLALLSKWVRTRGASLWPWIPVAVAAVLLVTVFILGSTRIPS